MTQVQFRAATFNASLNRSAAGELVSELSSRDNLQARTVAEIVQRTAPDVLLINEFDYVSGDTALNLFRENYLAAKQNTLNLADGGRPATNYDYAFTAPSNTGVASGFDLNNNGVAVTTPGAAGYGDDAYGFGNYPGQYGMAIYSKYEVLYDQVRTFQNFLWKDMPDARLPDDAATPEAGDYYSADELAVLPLSSKSHWDVPVLIEGEVVHLIVAHPTPPTFDGPEDRNGLRNADEIRLIADYVTAGRGDYIYDDQGVVGGLEPGARFVIMGDMNADLNDGDSVDTAINQLLDADTIDDSVVPTSAGAIEQSAIQGGANASHTGDPAHDTADFADGAPGNLRADYVLPSVAGLTPLNGEVFWPVATDPTFALAGTYSPNLPPNGFPASDHRLVTMDFALDPVFKTLSGDAPEVIAHRGASGARPEHTLEAYRVAIEQGADTIEPDLVLTKDGYLIDRHEPMLSGTTDIADHPEFADRYVTKVLEGETITDWWAEDFTLAEIKTLYARERIPQLRPDNAAYDDQFRIPTLEEVIDLVQQVETDTGRVVSIIPETKHPTYFEYNGFYADGGQIGVDTSKKLIDVLVAQGFTDPSRLSIQSFEIANLIKLQTESMPAVGLDIPLVQLLYNNYSPDIAFHLNPANAALGADPMLFDGFNYPLAASTVAEVGGGGLYSAEAIQAMADLYAEAISPYKEDVYLSKPLAAPVDYDGDGVPLIAAQLTGEEVPLVARAHAAGIEAVVYTLRDEEFFSSLNPDGTVQRPVEEYIKAIESGFDGLFTDFPGTGRLVVDQLLAGDGAISVPGAISTLGGDPVGNDIVVRSPGALTAAKGSSGIDTAIYAGSGTLDLLAAKTVENVELRGEAGATVLGNRLGNRITGSAGDDRLSGRAGDDQLQGGAGEDVLRGGNGDDILFGDAGDDRLVGGAGGDELTGGEGADRFVFRPGSGNDTVVDFEGGVDLLDLQAFGFGSAEEVLQSAVEFRSSVFIALGSGDNLLILNLSAPALSDSILA